MMKMRDAAARVGRVAWWRGYASWAHPLASRLGAQWGSAARLIRWPAPGMAPYRRNELHLCRGYGLGDVLMCTPAMRELKRLNPGCRVTFYTDFPDLVEGLPFIDCVRPTVEAVGTAIWLTYEPSLPPRRHLARIIGDSLGINVRDVRPSCVVRSELVERYRQDWKSLPRPLVLVTRRASAFTPNKDWPDAYWDELVARLAARATVIEVGGRLAEPSNRPTGSYIDLRGQTTLPELIAVVAAVDLQVAPITGTIHIAAALGIPSVVIYGGYEPPVCTDYTGNIGLYSPVECAPCWLKTPCPYGKKCLHMITPNQVEAALDCLWEDRQRQRNRVEPAGVHGGGDGMAA
jgi:Glycosyltransferase family 9 (heptosyltransferase)